MKQAYALLLSFILLSNVASATNKFWVGPLNGTWSSPFNWSLVSGGAGGAGAPGANDDINFTGVAKIVVDMSPVVHGIYTNSVTAKVVLIANTNVTLTINSALNIGFSSYIKDSTGADVSFNVNFTNGSSASIQGDWIFEGGTPVTGTNGASFMAPVGTLVHVTRSPIANIGGRIICNKNSKPISSVNTTLIFGYDSYFISDNVTNVAIPYATWSKDSLNSVNNLAGPASTILLSGNLSSVHHLATTPLYGRMVIDLSTLANDVSLSLTDGTRIRGNFEILNTNNHNLTLLSSVSNTSTVEVEVGYNQNGYPFAGYLTISGNSNVTMARATANTAANTYKLIVDKSYKQSGGNFSLQDYDGATGSSTLSIKDDMIQTAGTFVTNSTATNSSVKFTVSMEDPKFNPGPSGNFGSSRVINMSTGTIDNGRKMVTLRIDHTVYNLPGYASNPNGVILQSALNVGKLELVNSPLTSTTTNILTVLNPSPGSITMGSNKSYVNGPLRRATNSTSAYCFPTGKGNNAADGYVFDSCLVTPSTADVSMFETAYFDAPGNAAIAAPLQGISSKSWKIGKLTGMANASVTLILNGAVSGSSALKGIVVANFNGGMWEKVNGTILSPGNAITGSVTSKPMQTFGYFTFGYGVPRPLATPSLINNLGISTQDSNSFTSAKVMQEDMEAPVVFPNPFVDNFMMNFNNSGNVTNNAAVNIYDLKGSLVYTQKLGNLIPGHNTTKVNLGGKNMPAANYVAQLNINGAVVSSVKLLKK